MSLHSLLAIYSVCICATQNALAGKMKSSPLTPLNDTFKTWHTPSSGEFILTLSILANISSFRRSLSPLTLSIVPSKS